MHTRLRVPRFACTPNPCDRWEIVAAENACTRRRFFLFFAARKSRAIALLREVDEEKVGDAKKAFMDSTLMKLQTKTKLAKADLERMFTVVSRRTSLPSGDTCLPRAKGWISRLTRELVRCSCSLQLLFVFRLLCASGARDVHRTLFSRCLFLGKAHACLPACPPLLRLPRNTR